MSILKNVLKNLTNNHGSNIIIGAIILSLPYDKLDFSMLSRKKTKTLQNTDPEPMPTPNMPSMPLQSGDIDPSRPMVALTFDDGPSEYTPLILDLLEHYRSRATFFVSGDLVELNRDIVKRAVGLGNEILGHAWNHHDLTELTDDEITAQLLNTNAVIKDVIGISPQSFRPPYGFTNDRVLNISRELGLGIIKWSLDSNDWETLNSDTIYNTIINNVEDRDIILAHDVYQTTVDAMEGVIPELITKGYQLVTISELMHYSGIEIQPGKIYSSGRKA